MLFYVVNEQQSDTYSKESKIAQLYQEKVYYPFINCIRRKKYNYNGDIDDIPSYLQCVSWMDGCNSQLRLITSEENMKREMKMRIVCCKHSAARTAVEQAADTGAMFKHLKKIVRTTENPFNANNSIHHHIQQCFEQLHNNAPDGDSLHLPSHKRKAILFTISKLPIAASRAYADHVIKKAFMLNGQLDIDNQVVPSLDNCLNTYRGDMAGTCLMEKKKLIESLYEHAYTNGMIEDSEMDKLNIPKDSDCHGRIIHRDFTISNENRQRAKCLNSTTQIEERRSLVVAARMAVYKKKLGLHEAEQKEYNNNKVCELKLLSLYNDHICKLQLRKEMENTTASIPSTHKEHIHTLFSSMSDRITYKIVKEYKGKDNILKCDLKAFVRVRSERMVRNGKVTYQNVSDRKEELLVQLIEMRNAAVKQRIHGAAPELPI